MSSTGAGYDLGANIFSPEGRVFQVDYAHKAVEEGGAMIGLACADGVVLGVEKLQANKLALPGSARQIHSIDKHAGIAFSGYVPDGRALIPAGADECANYYDYYKEQMPPHVLADRLGQYMHAHTCYGGYRPFGVSLLVAGFDQEAQKAYLHLIHPSGENCRYFGAAVGKGQQTAIAEIEKLDLKKMSVKEGLEAIAFIIRLARDERDKPYEFEASWICKSSNWEHELVPGEIKDAADKAAAKKKEELDQGYDDMDE